MKMFFADVVISNVDVYFTYLKLLNNEYKAKKNLKQERSSSALIFYWGIKQEFPQLQLHNIFFSNDYEAEFKSIFKTKILTMIQRFISISLQKWKQVFMHRKEKKTGL